MSKTQDINRILGIKESYKAPDRIMEILTGDTAKRDVVLKEFLELFEYNMSFDWFHEYFQEEHADRKTQKHDYTPESVAKLVNQLTAKDTRNLSVYDVASGTGGLIITRWHQDRMATNPFTYRPSDYLYHAEELSDRSIPFLLFNLIIRGMNATVMHGDVLTRDCYGVFFIQNDYDDHMLFSSLNVFPYNQSTAEMFNVKFAEERYDPLIQTPGIPKHVIDGVDRKADEEAWKMIQMMVGLDAPIEDEKLIKNESEPNEKELPKGQMTLFDL